MIRQQHPINIRAIDHIVLCVNDLSQMIKFYQNVLGCRMGLSSANSTLADLHTGQSVVDLVAVDREKPRAQNLEHLSLRISPWNVEIIREHLHQHGVDVGEISTRYGATKIGTSFFISDPEGNSVELSSMGVLHEN